MTYPARIACISRPHHALRRDSGFTLLEVLVAVMVLSIIMTTAFGALRLGARSWEAGVTRAIETGDFRTAAGFLQRQINQTLAMTWPGENTGRIAFSGLRNRLRFIGPAPQQQQYAGLFEYTLAVRTQDLEKELVLSYVPFNPGNNNFQTPRPDQQQVLAQGLTAVSFEYYGVNTVTGATTTTAAAAWHRHWAPDAQQLPELIKIHVQAESPERQWPDLIIAVHARLQS